MNYLASIAIGLAWVLVVPFLGALLRRSRLKSERDMRAYLHRRETSPSASLNSRKYSRVITSRRVRWEEGGAR